jgi:hypothetical protein
MASDAGPGVQIAAHVAAMPHNLVLDLIKELMAQGTSVISLYLDDHDLSGASSVGRTVDLVNSVDIFLPSWRDGFAIVSLDEPIKALQQLSCFSDHVQLPVFPVGIEVRV